MIKFKVYRRNSNGYGKTFLTMIEDDKSFTAEEIKSRLIRNGWNENIIVRKY